jgi:hypothetical protein
VDNSSRQRRRRRGSGNKPSADQNRNDRGQKGGGNRGKGGRKRGPQRRDRRTAEDGPAFWGETSKLPPAQPDVRITDHPSAVPRSLGRPPLPGHEMAAEHYFGVVYDRAVSTAGALAAAGGLIDPEALLDDDED